MAADLDERVRQRPAPMPGRGGTMTWIAQALSGVLLIILLGVHIVTEHFVAKGGLRDYAQVVSYLSNPLVLAVESLFVVVLIWHAMLGLRAILFDFGFGARAETMISRAVIVLGAATAGYSFWIIAAIAGGH